MSPARGKTERRTNIIAGTYTATVSSLPNGVSVSGNVIIAANGSGTLTLSGNTRTVAGTYSTLRLTIDNTQSANFTLTISAPVLPRHIVTFSVSGGNGNGTLTARVDGNIITSGASVEQGKSVDFTTTPSGSGSRVREWRVNGNFAAGNTNTYTLTNISGAATVTVSFDRITGAEILPETNPLQAWVRDGQLYVSGLTAGETLSIYTASGALVHQSVATSNEANIPLSIQGVYIVHSGDKTIRVVFH